MGSATQNPVKLEKISLAASKHKLDNLFTDARIVLHANPYDEFHSESKRPLPPVSELRTGLIHWQIHEIDCPRTYGYE